jgi:hypothetical protein
LALIVLLRSQYPAAPAVTAGHADRERAMRETKFILEATACLATLIMLALAVADWVLKFIT